MDNKLLKFYEKYRTAIHGFLLTIFLYTLAIINFGPINKVKLPDDPATKWVYSGWTDGFPFYSYEARLTEVCSLCLELTLKLIPFLANISIYFVLLYVFLVRIKILKRFVDSRFPVALFCLLLVYYIFKIGINYYSLSIKLI